MGEVRIKPLGLSGLTIEGELDAATAPTLVAATTGLGSQIRLDLSGCTFMDSSGISALISIQRHAADDGGSLYLVDPSPVVRRVLTICGLIDSFRIE